MKINYIYKPVVFILIFFLLDKVFLLDYFKKDFVQNGNVVYYTQREMLLERLKNAKAEKKKIIVFGDSRAYAFSDLGLPADQIKKWEIWNFSAPQAPPVYSFYMLEKMIQAGIRPDVIFFVVSPEGFDDAKGLIHTPFMRLGGDRSFIKQYWEHFPEKDRNDYIMDQLFAVRGIEFDLQLFVSRLLSGRLEIYDPAINKDVQILNFNKGESLVFHSYANDHKKLTKHSAQMKAIYLRNFKVNETQFYFTEKLLSLAQENRIEVISIWPKVYPEYRKGFAELGLTDKWWRRITGLAEKFGMKSIDFNTASGCENYYDASHQNVTCIAEQTELLINSMDK